MILDTHREIWPAIEWSNYTNGYPIWILTVLSVNEDYCAAYRGICPDMSQTSEEHRTEVIESVRAHGNKIPETEARELFPQIEAQQLRYRR